MLSYANKFSEVIDSIYQHQGYIRHYDFGEEFTISQDILAYAHSNNLIEIDQSKNVITLTQKGKYFVSLFTVENKNKTYFSQRAI